MVEILGMDGDIYYMALRDISKGKELSRIYGPDYWTANDKKIIN